MLPRSPWQNGGIQINNDPGKKSRKLADICIIKLELLLIRSGVYTNLLRL